MAKSPLKGGNKITTRSGQVIKIHRSLSERWQASRQSKARRKAERMRGLPKSRIKRWVWQLDPRRQAEYWFSRDGAVAGLKVLGIAIVALFIIMLGVFAYFRKDLPNITDISGSNLGGSISYYDRTGKILLWQDYNAVKRVPVQSSSMSNYMKEATIATEDRNFYNEKGFDIKSVVRAALVDAFHLGSTQGGSTITEQLVKLTQDFNQNRSITLKVKELILAVELERTYTKDQILTGYLNAAPYGGVDYGIQAAASDYFHTDAAHLTLAQSAFLATIPKSPTYYSPYSAYFDKAAFVGRYDYVLDSMVQTGKISKSQADAAKGVNILAQVQPQQTKYAGIQAPYFVLSAKEQLQQQFVPNDGNGSAKIGGWKVITTLDMSLQQKAEQLVQSNLPAVQRLTGGAADEEATVLENVPTGQIEALVGGTDFNNPDHGQDNYASGILIPPGSSFKPYDYTTLINNNNNVGAGSVLYDTQGPLPGYPCTNKARPFINNVPTGGNCLWDYDFIYPGPLTLRYALGGSRNVPAVKAMLEAVPNDTSNGHTTSINKVISTASAMMDNTYLQSQGKSTYNCYSDEQLTKTTQCYGASAIGDGAFLHLDDHVNGDATLGRLGSAIPHTYILKITDSSNKTVYQWTQPKGTQVVKQDSAYIVDNMLSDPNASYLPGSCSATNCTSLAQGGYKFQHDNGWDFAVKTGTTNDGFDGLMTSWSSQWADVSWVGNHNRNVNLSAAHGAAMETLTEPLTRGMMEAAHAGMKPQNWTEPTDIKMEQAFVVRNHIHYGDIEPSPSTDLFPSWYAGGNKSSNSSQTIDKVSGKIATSCTPDDAKQTQDNANASSWNIDIFNGGSPSIGGNSVSGNTSSATDDVHQCSDQKPSISLTVTDSNGNSDGNCTNSCTFTAAISAGTHPLDDPQYAQFPGSVTFSVNGNQVDSIPTASGGPYTYTYTPTSSGSITVSATVTDSVLYQGTDSTTITASTQAAGPTNFGASRGSGNNISFSWSGGSGPYTVYRSNSSGSPTAVCTSSSTSCSGTSAPNGSFYVQDSTGAKSSSVNA